MLTCEIYGGTAKHRPMCCCILRGRQHTSCHDCLLPANGAEKKLISCWITNDLLAHICRDGQEIHRREQIDSITPDDEVDHTLYQNLKFEIRHSHPNMEENENIGLKHVEDHANKRSYRAEHEETSCSE